jgi:peptidyl-prolyl cis-trans isomerase C
MSCQARSSVHGVHTNVVSVNGVVISHATIAREVQHHPASKPILAWQYAARALVVRELLLQEARRLGLSAVPAVDSCDRRETDEEALIRIVFEHEVTIPEPDRESCRRYYEQNQRRFHSADLYEAAHILFAADRRDASAYARAQTAAAAVLAELGQAPERFSELARLHSACSSAANGGNLGQISAGQTTPEFERALRELEPGMLTAAPVASRYGFHVIRLDRRIPGTQLPFEFVADRIADYLAQRAHGMATAQYIARLVSSAEITGVDLAGAEALLVH